MAWRASKSVSQYPTNKIISKSSKKNQLRIENIRAASDISAGANGSVLCKAVDAVKAGGTIAQ